MHASAIENFVFETHGISDVKRISDRWSNRKGTIPKKPSKIVEFGYVVETDIEDKSDSSYDVLQREIYETRKFFDNLEYDDGDMPVSPETLESALIFLGKLYRKADDESKHLKPPLISPAETGSVDVYWKNMRRSLLINFPAEEGGKVVFYGENSEGDTLSGSFANYKGQVCFLNWLTN